MPALLARPVGGRHRRRPRRSLRALLRCGGSSDGGEAVTRLLSLLLAALVVAGDQATKSWGIGFFDGAGIPRRPVTPFFNLVLAWNRGVSFGLFNRDSSWNVVLFSLLAAAIVATLLVWLWRSRSALVAAGIGFITGGAVGNVIDRLRLGAVTDFLDFYWGDWHFPAFNLADSAITVGVSLLVLDGLLGRRESPN